MAGFGLFLSALPSPKPQEAGRQALFLFLSLDRLRAVLQCPDTDVLTDLQQWNDVIVICVMASLYVQKAFSAL
jgi:hypothetical protein